MTLLYCSAAVLAALLALPCASAAQGRGGKVEAEILRLEAARIEAMLKADARELDRLLADDLTYAHSDGRVDTKAQFIRTYTSGESRYMALDRDTPSVRVYGNTAVVTGTAKIHVRSPKGDSRFQLGYLDVYARRGGRWQMVAWQSTRLPQ
jgi:ketosteroid isomerase-like protein